MLPLFLGFQALLFHFLWLICLCCLFVSLLPKQWVGVFAAPKFGIGLVGCLWKCRRISERTLELDDCDVSPYCPVCCCVPYLPLS
uniref:Uncharacterized protein n=1 Tax=Acanthochromis polyacanthus TaxID=80966 RepID=A0A3Q1ECE2_9TELE